MSSDASKAIWTPKILKHAVYLWQLKLRWNALVMANRQNASSEHLNESTPSVKPQYNVQYIFFERTYGAIKCFKTFLLRQNSLTTVCS